MDRPLCRRCLLNELDDGELYGGVTEYVESIPMDEKAPREEYARRLERCKACDNLVNGMCALCGCFVEMRAAKLRRHCAKSEEIW